MRLSVFNFVRPCGTEIRVSKLTAGGHSIKQYGTCTLDAHNCVSSNSITTLRSNMFIASGDCLTPCKLINGLEFNIKRATLMFPTPVQQALHTQRRFEVRWPRYLPLARITLSHVLGSPPSRRRRISIMFVLVLLVSSTLLQPP